MVVGVTLTEEKLLSRNVPALYPLGTRYTGTTPLIMQIKKHLCLHQEMFLRKCCGAGGEDVKDDMIKRYIGHAVRQIMESSGYHLDKQNVRIPRGILFKTFSRYRSDAERAKLVISAQPVETA